MRGCVGFQMLGKIRFAVVCDDGNAASVSVASISDRTPGTSVGSPGGGNITVTISGVSAVTPGSQSATTARTHARERFSSSISCGRSDIVGVIKVTKAGTALVALACDPHDGDR